MWGGGAHGRPEDSPELELQAVVSQSGFYKLGSFARTVSTLSCGAAVSPALTPRTKLGKIGVRNLEETDQQERGSGSAGLDLSVGSSGLRRA